MKKLALWKHYSSIRRRFVYPFARFMMLSGGLVLFSSVPCLAAQLDGQENQAEIEKQSAMSSLPSSAYLDALPLSFESNRGQIANGSDYLARGPGYTLSLFPDEMVLRLRSGRSPDADIADEIIEGRRNRPDNIVRMQIVNGNPEASTEVVESLPGEINYLIGHDPAYWQTNIPTQARVRYSGVYPGIDLEYYGLQGRLEYDFVVAPGSDPEQIRVSFQGVERMEIDDNGDLLLHTSNGLLRQKAPLSYQEVDGQRRIVPSHFVSYSDVAGEAQKGTGQIGFELAAYDKHLPLVIDPALAYASYFGGSSTERAYGIATDSSGNTYLTGNTSSYSDFPLVDPYQGTYPNGDNGFISKISADGSTLIYSTYLGGTGYDYPQDIAVDSDGNAYVIGQTSSTDFPLSADAIQEVYGGGANDVFVAKLSASGDTLIYSSYLGGSNSDYGQGIAVDNTGQAYVTGYTWSTDFPTYNALYSSFQGQSNNAFVAQINDTATALVYSTYLGISQGFDIAVDSDGNAYVTGVCWDDFPVTSGAYSDSGPIFVSKIIASGASLAYSSRLGGSGGGYGYGIALDGENRAYITGKTYAADFPVVGAYQTAQPGGYDAFLVQLESDGSDILYASYIGGLQEDIGYAVAVDASGTVYVTGKTASPEFPVKNPFAQGSAYGGGNADAFVSRFDPFQTGDDSLLYSVFLGGEADDEGRAIVSPASGITYLAGITRSGAFPLVTPLQGTIAPSSYGGYNYDAFVAVISDDQAYAELALSIEDLADPVESGAEYSYQVHLLNNGSEAASGVLLSNTLAAGVTYISASATRGTPVYSNGVVTLDVGSVAYLETVTLNVTVAAPGIDTTLINMAEVSSSTADPVPGNNSVTEDTLVRSQYHTFTFYNRNSTNTSDPSCGTVTSTPPGLNCSADCTADFLEDTKLRLTASYPAGCELVRWTGGDYGYCGASDSDCIATVFDGAWAKAEFRWIDSDLLLTSEDLPDPAMVSDTVDYHLTIRHIGIHQATDLVLIDTLPPEVTYIGSTTSSGSCSYDNATHQVSCNINFLWAGQQVDVIISVAAPATATILTNQATVSNSVIDLDLSNNTITEITTVTDQQQTLTVIRSGDGNGTVTSSLAGIDCGSDCSESYPQDTLVSLVATADRGSFFTGWSGGDCSGNGRCEVMLDVAKTVTAAFSGSLPQAITLPKTGQNTCFDDSGTVIVCAGTGQDGEVQAGIPWPEPRFELTYNDENGSCADQTTDCDDSPDTDTITDLLTGLVWSRSSDLSSGPVPWQQALDTVFDMNLNTGLGGYSDWRVPNVNELASLLLHQKGGYQVVSWLADQGFIIDHHSWIWSSTTYVYDTGGGYAYSLGLQLSDLQYFSKQESANNRVWAVRGISNGPGKIWKTKQQLCYDTAGTTIDCTGTGQDGEIQAGADWPNPRFSVIYGDSNGLCSDQSTDCDTDEKTDMVRDNLTGLLLTRDANPMGGSGTMQAARDALTTLNSSNRVGGVSDWRLPNIHELLSLVDFNKRQPSVIEGHPFVGLQPNRYWSSTTTDLNTCSTGSCTDRAYTMSFYNGRISSEGKIRPYSYLWPVREDMNSADLKLTISDSADPIQVGGTLTYTMDIANFGPGDATGVTLENHLPAEVSFISVSSDQGSCSENTGIVSCNMDDIGRNASSTVTVEVVVGVTPLTIENSATVSTSKNDSNTRNNAAVETTRISNTDYTLTVTSSGNGSGRIVSTPAGIDCGVACSQDYFETSPVVLDVVADAASRFMAWLGCDQVTDSQCTVSMNSNRTVTALFDPLTTADYYVSVDGDDTNSGLGWSRPFKTIDKALSVAESGEEIWVTAGTYEPPVVSEYSKTSYFALYKKVQLYGGFDGTETVRSARDPEANQTVVDARSGDYYGQGFYVNTRDDSGPGRARIDGFVVRGGWALGNYYPIDTGGGIIVYSGAPLIANCDIMTNYAKTGGGIAAGYGTTIVNSRIHHNNAQNYGGGIQGNTGVQVINSAVYENYSTYSGGGIAFWGGGSILSSTLTGNTILNDGAGVAAGFHGYYNGTTTISNSIIWGNSQRNNPSEISFDSSGGARGAISYSNLRGGYTGTGNIDSNPLFLDISNGDLRAQPFALSINTGNTAAVPADIADLDGDGDTGEPLPLDIAGHDRIASTIVDMGAYEYAVGLYSEHTLGVVVEPAGSGSISGPGISCSDSCGVRYFSGTRLTAVAVSQSPYRFAYWQGCDNSDREQCAVAMDAEKAVTAHMVHETEDADSDDMPDWWEYHYFNDLDRNGAGDYDQDGLSDKDEFSWGTEPDSGDSDHDGMLDGWEIANGLLPTVDDADLDPDGDTLTNLVEHEIGTNPQVYDIPSYTLRYTSGADGSLSGETTQSVEYGHDGTQVVALADSHFHFAGWSDGDDSAARTDTYVTSDITVTANFSIDTYTLTYSAGENGSISGDANQMIDYGGDATTVIAVPDAGYVFVSWSDALTTASRTDTNIVANMAVSASFCLAQTWYEDADGDGYSVGTPLISCERPVDYYSEDELESTSGDNCPTVANSNQTDANNDGVGDACEDNDGIAAEIDGHMDGGEFVSESRQFSASFTDVPQGGVTSGSISDRADLILVLEDLSEPDGISITASVGTGAAKIDLCGLELAVTNGDNAIASCGSLTLEVISGPMEVHLGGADYVIVPSGVTAKISKISDQTFTIENQSGSGMVVVHVADQVLDVKPGEKVEVEVSDETTFFVIPVPGGKAVIFAL